MVLQQNAINSGGIGLVASKKAFTCCVKTRLDTQEESSAETKILGKEITPLVTTPRATIASLCVTF